MTIPADILEFIDSHRLSASALRGLAALLPEDHAVLAGWVDEAIDEMEPEVFQLLMLAGQHGGFRLKAERFAAALSLVHDPHGVCNVACHLEGDVAEAVCEALNRGPASLSASCHLCLVAAHWSVEHRGGVAPARLHPQLCGVARNKSLEHSNRIVALAAACILEDETLIGMLLPRLSSQSAGLRAEVLRTSREAGDALIAAYRKPAVELLTETATPVISNGRLPMRRAAARTGSNEPCPCGSGKKYKRCCMEKDSERLRQSSEVPGRTWREARRGREAFLTVETMQKMVPADIFHIDARKLKKAVIPGFFFQAGSLRQFGTCARALTELGWDAENKELFEAWTNVIFVAAMDGRQDAVAILSRVVPDPDEALRLMEPIGRLVLTSGEPGRHLQLLEETAVEAIKTREDPAMLKAALGLLRSACPALGILAARSFIPLLPRKDAGFILEQIIETRDRLHLPPEDPYSDILEKRFSDEAAGGNRESETTRKVRHQLETKACEVRNLRAQLDHLHGELERKERRARPAPEARTGVVPLPAAEESLKDLRRKVGELKGLLQQRQEERAALRSELEKAHTELEKTRAAAPGAQSSAAADAAEDAHLLPAEPGINHPVRVPSFPRHFHDILHHIPRHTARLALETVGRLCGGESSAFHGVVRLKAIPSVHRVRLGIDYRLLFKLSGETLEVVDLISRQDLEKRIRTLTA